MRAARAPPRAAGRAAPVRHQHGGAGVGQHERQPLARIVRVERQIGAAGLEDASSPTTISGERSTQQPDHGLGPDAQALQMMRQAVGVGLERGVAQRCGPRTPPPPASGVRRPAPQTAPAGRRPRQRRRSGCARAVSFHAAGWCRAPPASRIGSAPSARRGSATAAASSRISRCAQRRHAGLVEQVAGVFQHALDAGRRAVGAAPLDQPERQVELGAGGRDRLQAAPRARAAPAPPPAAPVSNASITWNSGCRDSDRAGLSTSTSRSNGSSAWP